MKLVSVETPEKSVCKMTFSASAEELEAASNAVYERTRATYTIKGFAKGEADRAQIEADRGEHTFWYDAINDLMDKDVPALYDAAMAEHGFHAVDEPVYDLVSVKKDEGFVATATTALQPELNLTQTTGFKTECVTPEITDKEIDAVLERRRAMAAELVPHKGPAVKGNIVHIDYEGLLEGKPFNGGTAQNQTLQLGSGRMIPGFEEGILGHKGGEEFDIFVTFPARYHVKDLAGKPVVFKIKLHDVCVRQLPALNSDFAKKAANVDTMDEFRAQIRQQLHDNKHAAALNRAKDAILTQLAAAAEGELPSVLVESAYQQEMEQIQQQLQMQRLSLDRYLSRSIRPARASLPLSALLRRRTPAPGWPCCRSLRTRTSFPLRRTSTRHCLSALSAPRRPSRKSRLHPTWRPSAATRASAALPTMSSSTPPSKKNNLSCFCACTTVQAFFIVHFFSLDFFSLLRYF